MGTDFTTVYNRFLGKITDDMYVELTPQDTIRDLRNMIIDAIPGFEFPKHNLYDYTIEIQEMDRNSITVDDFVLGEKWEDEDVETPKMLVDKSRFNSELTPEEINILALLMK